MELKYVAGYKLRIRRFLEIAAALSLAPVVVKSAYTDEIKYFKWLVFRRESQQKSEWILSDERRVVVNLSKSENVCLRPQLIDCENFLDLSPLTQRCRCHHRCNKSVLDWTRQQRLAADPDAIHPANCRLRSSSNVVTSSGPSSLHTPTQAAQLLHRNRATLLSLNINSDSVLYRVCVSQRCEIVYLVSRLFSLSASEQSREKVTDLSEFYSVE